MILLTCGVFLAEFTYILIFFHIDSPRIISFKINKSGISRLRDARDTIAVGQQGQALILLVEPQGCFIDSQFP